MKTKLYLIAALLLCGLLGGCRNPWMEKILEPLFLYKVGDTGPGGGVVFYDKGNSSGGWRYLEVAPGGWYGIGPDDPLLEWAPGTVPGTPGYENVPGATGIAIGTGRANTRAIIAIVGDADPATNCPAAWACVNYRGGGKSDWFLPSLDELNELYKQSYVVGGFDLINSYPYWSSSQYSEYAAFCQYFTFGSLDVDGKFNDYPVRPIRAF